MSAYNRRFEPRRLFGMPLLTAAATTAAVATVALAWMTASIARLLFVAVAVVSAAIALAALRLGDDLPLLSVRLMDARERRLAVREAWVRR
ncbi:MAG: hypothetical protein ACYCQK_07025 [Acidiferrobacteraceae bacterium]